MLSDYIKMLAFVCLTHQRRAGPSGPAITWPHTSSRVAKQSLSKQDTSISVAPGLHRLPACSNAWGSGVCSVSLLVFIFISFRIAVICLVVCKEGKPKILVTREEARSLPSTVAVGLAKPLLDFHLGESVTTRKGCGSSSHFESSMSLSWAFIFSTEK